MKRCVAFLGLVSSFATLSWGADLKVTIVKDPERMDQTQQASVSPATPSTKSDSVTIYVHGSTQRIEFLGPVTGIQPFHVLTRLPSPPVVQSLPHIAVITHCDTGIVDELYLDTHTYAEFKAPKYLDEKHFLKLAQEARHKSEKEITATTSDTGESRDVFGHTAHHKMTTIHQKTAGNRIASSVLHGETVTTEVTFYRDIQYQEAIDGWYIDLPQPGCAPEYLRQGLAVPATVIGDCGGNGGLPISCYPLAGGDVRQPSDADELRSWHGFRAYSPMPGPADTSIPLGLREITVDDYTQRSSTSFVRTFLIYTGFLPSGLAVAQNTSGEITLKEYSSSKGITKAEVPWGYTVTELSEEPLAPALFTVPADFKKIH
jgi:hypothetical protein